MTAGERDGSAERKARRRTTASTHLGRHTCVHTHRDGCTLTRSGWETPAWCGLETALEKRCLWLGFGVSPDSWIHQHGLRIRTEILACNGNLGRRQTKMQQREANKTRAKWETLAAESSASACLPALVVGSRCTTGLFLPENGDLPPPLLPLLSFFLWACTRESAGQTLLH